MNQLEKEIREQASQIYRDSYQMSIGELINIYKDNEMEIHPEFQRVYRWTETQKTRLIESILLNIPIPSIFVSQDDDGVWDIVDGVQRLSTIFQFVGVLRDENDELVPPLVLQKTKYLPSLDGVRWEAENDGNAFSSHQRIDFKRSRIDVVIVKKESDPKTKYELFQRLNTGGTSLSEQEVRNCLLIMTNKEFYYSLSELDRNEYYLKTTSLLTDKKVDEQYRKELLLRLLVATQIEWKILSEYTEFSEMLDQESIRISTDNSFDINEFETKFSRTFELIFRELGEDAFRRYDSKSSKFVGALINGSFQPIAYGVYMNIDTIEKQEEGWLLSKVKEMYLEPDFERNMGLGVRPIQRFRDLSIFGEAYFGESYENTDK